MIRGAEGFRDLGRRLDAAGSDRATLHDALEAVVAAYVGFASRNPALFDLMAGSRYLVEAPAALLEARDAAFEPVRRILTWGQQRGELTGGDIRRIGTLFFASTHGLAAMANNGMIDPRDDGLIRDAVASLLIGLRPSPESP